MSNSTIQNKHSTPIGINKLTISHRDSKLSSFDQNYTLTGLIREIQTSISNLITSKRQPQICILNLQDEMQVLEKIQEEVLILKTIITHNINQIFLNIYPSNSLEKSQFHTDHTDKRKKSDSLKKSATITEFSIEGSNKINSLEVNKENLTSYQKRYSQQKISQKKQKRNKKNQRIIKVDKKQIKIQEQIAQIQEGLDLKCYQKDLSTNMNNKRVNQQMKGISFSPIYQRPIQQEFSIKKEIQIKDKIIFDNKKIIFNQNRQNLYINFKKDKQQINKNQFDQNSHNRRLSNRKFNYLEQVKKY